MVAAPYKNDQNYVNTHCSHTRPQELNWIPNNSILLNAIVYLKKNNNKS
jgi:hypothetical protein